MFVRRAQIGHDMFTEAPKVESVAVGEKPALITEAAHLLDTDEFDRAGQQRRWLVAGGPVMGDPEHLAHCSVSRQLQRAAKTTNE